MLAGCAGAADTAKPTNAEIDREKELQRRIEVRQGAYQQLPETVSETLPQAIVGEVPDAVLTAIKADLAEKLGADVVEINIVTARSVTWNDGSLGCPRPDQAYTQALVPGYHVVLELAGIEYDYRAAETGFFFLCELPTLVQPSNNL
jgi:hypothetical protein